MAQARCQGRAVQLSVTATASSEVTSMATIRALKKAEASDEARQVYDEILSTYTAYNLKEPHEIYRLMGHTPDFLASNWPRSRYLYGGQPEDQDKSRSRLSLKEKHLVTLAVSATNNCEYCVRIHTTRLRQLGATSEELLEALTVAAATTGFDRIAEGTRAGDRPTISPAAGSDTDSQFPSPSSYNRPGQDPDEVFDMLAHRPDLLRVHGELARGVLYDGGLLGDRLKRMLAFAVSATNGADYYIARHTHGLREIGLDQEELVELLLIVDLTCGYNRYVQGLQVTASAGT